MLAVSFVVPTKLKCSAIRDMKMGIAMQPICRRFCKIGTECNVSFLHFTIVCYHFGENEFGINSYDV